MRITVLGMSASGKETFEDGAVAEASLETGARGLQSKEACFAVCISGKLIVTSVDGTWATADQSSEAWSPSLTHFKIGNSRRTGDRATPTRRNVATDSSGQ